MKKLFILLFTLITVVTAVTGFSVTALADDETKVTVSTAEGLKEALSNNLVTNVTLASDIALSETIDISKNNLVLNGRGFTLTGTTFTVDNVESLIEIDDVNFVSDGSTQNFIVIKNYSRGIISGCTFTGAAGYALDIKNGAETLKTVTVQNCTTENNGSGGILIDGKVNLKLVGEIKHKESVKNVELAALFESGSQKFAGPDGELSIGLVVKAGNVNKKDLDVDKYVIKENDGIGYYAVSFDSEAPYVNVASLGKTEVTRGQTVDISVIKITDNRTSSDKLKIYILAKDASGNLVTMQGADSVYVSGKSFVAENIGVYTVMVKAEDEYGNVSKERKIYYTVGSEYKAPVIEGFYISKLITVGKEVEIPSVFAIDYSGESISCSVSLKDSKGNIVEISNNKFTVTREGVYYLVYSATDDKNQTSQKKISLNAVNDANAEIEVETDKNANKGCGAQVTGGGTVAIFAISCIILGIKKKQVGLKGK